jgi:Fe-S-cluster containining protein
MSENNLFFSTGDVALVAEKIRVASKAYEDLFTNLGTQIYTAIRPLENPSDKVSVSLQYIADATVAFEQNFPSNHAVACSKGCHHCCYFPIETSQQVVDDIADYIHQHFTDAEIQHLKTKLAENIAARQPPLFRAACPFLDENKACSIYPKRPLACRWFSSPNADSCEQSVTDGRQIDQHPVKSRIYQAASTALLADQKVLTGSDQQLAFIPALANLL